MKVVYAFLGVLALLVAALFLVPMLLDWEQYKPEIAERLEAITGRDVAIDGPLAVTILPTPMIEAADLRIANAPGAADPDMARIGSLDLKLALGPLLGGEIAVTSLEMVDPVIELQRLADGRPNWLPESAPGQGAGGADPGEAGLTRIDSATVTNGTIVYRHAPGAPPERIEGIDATLTARSLEGPYRGEGTLAVRGRTIGFQFATATVREDRTVPVSLEATFDGERGSTLFEGTLKDSRRDACVRRQREGRGVRLRRLAECARRGPRLAARRAARQRVLRQGQAQPERRRRRRKRAAGAARRETGDGRGLVGRRRRAAARCRDRPQPHRSGSVLAERR